MSNWAAPIELSTDTPRNVKMNRGYAIGVGVMIITFIMIAAIGPATLISRYYKYESLKERGVAVPGKMISGWITSGKKSKGYHISYRYKLETNPDRSIEGEDFVSSYDYNLYKSGDEIPVIYDPIRPNRSMINIGDVVHTRDPSKELQGAITLVQIFTSILLVFIGIFLWPYPKERRLLKWGKARPVTILAEEEYRVKGGRLSKVTYQFIDDAGNRVQGKQKGVPVKDDPRSGAVEGRARFFRNPTVLFDPRNSKRSLLYPPLIAELRR